MDFYILKDLLFHPLASPAISLTLLAGIYRTSCSISSRLLRHTPSYCEKTCGSVIAIGLLSACSFLSASLGYVGHWGFRFVGYPLCMIGVAAFAQWLTDALTKIRTVKSLPRRRLGWDDLDRALIALIVLSIAFIAAGPPTDADSIGQHLGIPLDIINNGGIAARHDWLYYHLIGLGEFWNLFGLELGTDNLGAFTQCFALIMIAAMIAEKADSANRRLFVIKLVVATPVLLFLATGQKPQLIGTAAIASSVLLLANQSRQVWNGQSLNSIQDARVIFLSVGALFFALSIKYSFFLIGSAVFAYLFCKAFSAKQQHFFFLFSLLFYGLFLLPLHVHKYLTYGDPMSPIFTMLFSPGAHPYLTSFYHGLQAYNEGFSMPLGLIVPKTPGLASSILGLGVFSVFFISSPVKQFFPLMLIAAYGIVANLLGGQHTSRFFLEAYFLLISCVSMAPQLRPSIRIYSIMLTLQLAAVAGFAVFGAGLLFPGALTWKNRTHVLETTAFEYPEMQWLDSHLPRDAFVVSGLFANLFQPRPFLGFDYFTQPKAFLLEHLPPAPRSSYLVTAEPLRPDNVLYDFIAEKQGSAIPVRGAMRNPFNKKLGMLYVYRVRPR